MIAARRAGRSARVRSRRARYRFTRFWARLLVVSGFIAIAAGIVFAAIAVVIEEWRPGVSGTQAAMERVIVAGSLMLSGFLAGSPFIVFGQLLELFVDQRLVLSRILRALRRARAGGAPPPPSEPPPA